MPTRPRSPSGATARAGASQQPRLSHDVDRSRCTGLILDGRLYRGHRGRASEFGHACIEWDGERCGCGRRGCLEAYLGGAAWTRRLREITPRDEPESARSRAIAGACCRSTSSRLRGRAMPSRMKRWSASTTTSLARSRCSALRSLPKSSCSGRLRRRRAKNSVFEPVRALVGAQVWPTLCDGMRILPSGLGDKLPYYAGVCVAIEAQKKACPA